MHWVGLVLLAGAGAVAIRWLFNRVDSLGRARPFPWLAVVFLVAAGAAALTPWFLRVRLEKRLAEAASTFVGAPVDVHCQSFGEAVVDLGPERGYVPVGPNGVPQRYTLIKRTECTVLAEYLDSDKLRPTAEEVLAVHTLSHEAVHMSGVTDEAETECRAVQRDAEMARLLGAPPQAAEELAVTYWESFYPRMPEGYRSDQCRPGGAMDLGTADAPWR